MDSGSIQLRLGSNSQKDVNTLNCKEKYINANSNWMQHLRRSLLSTKKEPNLGQGWSH